MNISDSVEGRAAISTVQAQLPTGCRAHSAFRSDPSLIIGNTFTGIRVGVVGPNGNSLHSVSNGGSYLGQLERGSHGYKGEPTH